MLRGLPGIRLKLEYVRRNSLGEHPLIYHWSGPSIFGMDPPTPSSGLVSQKVLHVLQLAYLMRCNNAYV
jgi:hypothetical protein